MFLTLPATLIAGGEKHIKDQHPVMNYFDIGDGVAVCKTCKKQVVYRSKGYSTNLGSHLHYNHAELSRLYKEQQAQRMAARNVQSFDFMKLFMP